MIEREGDVFTTGHHAVGHGVNCQGVMGAGIAVQFKERFPQNYREYAEKCKYVTGRGTAGNMNRLSLGDVLITTERDRVDDRIRIVVNLASQWDVGAKATYEGVFRSLRKAADELTKMGYDKLAIPEIGCGIGGLEWPKVKTIIEALEIINPQFEYEVWHYA